MDIRRTSVLLVLPVLGEIYLERISADNLQLHSASGTDDDSSLARPVYLDDGIAIGAVGL